MKLLDRLSGERLPIILCIDDDAASLAIRKLLLEANGYSVLTATDGAMGITMARELYCDVVVLDFQMPVLNGDEVAKVLKKEHPTLPIILFTGFSEEIPKDLSSKIDGYLNKGSGDLSLTEGYLTRITLHCRDFHPVYQWSSCVGFNDQIFSDVGINVVSLWSSCYFSGIPVPLQPRRR